ncbi:MAG: InlB B-repeat-containing protein [Treponema sp.]|nr:InlB B-repeat-containing protein [Treponema sp.]
MNKLLKNFFYGFVLLAFIITVCPFLVSCAGGAGGGSSESDSSALCVQMPSTRSVQYDFSDVEIFTVTIRSSVYDETKSCGQGETLFFSDVPVGHYEITALGKKSDGTVTASGTATVDVESGVTKSVSVRIVRLNHHTVSFLNEDGSVYSSQEVSDGYCATQPDNPEFAGHDFSFWTVVESAASTVDGSASPFSFNTEITADIMLKPVCDVITYTITYVSVPKAVASDTFTVAGRETLPSPSKSGLTFVGWYEDEEFTGSKIESIPEGTTGNMTLYAKWTVKVTFNALNNNSTERNVVYGGTVAQSSEPTKSNYAFVGWYKGSMGTGNAVTYESESYDFDTPVTSSFTLYAKWLYSNASFTGTVAEFLATEFCPNTSPDSSYSVTITSATADQIANIARAIGNSSDSNYKGVYITLDLSGCGATEIPYGAFWSGTYAGTGIATYLTGIVLPSGLESIGSNAFNGCSGITGRITIPSNVREMGDDVFNSCTGITEVTIEDGVTKIGTYAFKGCTGISSPVTIPDTVTEIYAGSFYECTYIPSISVTGKWDKYWYDDMDNKRAESIDLTRDLLVVESGYRYFRNQE